MSSPYIQNIIRNGTSDPQVVKHMLKLAGDFDGLKDCSYLRLRRIRARLNDYIRTLPPKKYGYGCAAVYVVKKIMAKNGHQEYVRKKDTYHKSLTDHAFCRALERFYGVDVNALKDQVLNDMEENENMRPIVKDGMIVTFVEAA